MRITDQFKKLEDEVELKLQLLWSSHCQLSTLVSYSQILNIILYRQKNTSPTADLIQLFIAMANVYSACHMMMSHVDACHLLNVGACHMLMFLYM